MGPRRGRSASLLCRDCPWLTCESPSRAPSPHLLRCFAICCWSWALRRGVGAAGGFRRLPQILGGWASPRRAGVTGCDPKGSHGTALCCSLLWVRRPWGSGGPSAQLSRSGLAPLPQGHGCLVLTLLGGLWVGGCGGSLANPLGHGGWRRGGVPALSISFSFPGQGGFIMSCSQYLIWLRRGIVHVNEDR